MLSIGFAVIGSIATPVPAFAVQPDEILSDPALEARARVISAELRCLVCQNQSIDESNAPLARDLRLLVRERLKSGDSNSDVLDFVVARYGDFVLLRPPLKPETYLLWFSPIAILAIAVMLLAIRSRRPSTATPAAVPLSAEEQRQLDQVLGKAGEPATEIASDRASSA